MLQIKTVQNVLLNVIIIKFGLMKTMINNVEINFNVILITVNISKIWMNNVLKKIKHVCRIICTNIKKMIINKFVVLIHAVLIHLFI